MFDIAIIGGGIVGVSTALALKRQYPDAKTVLVEKENQFAAHQTGHNSGVVHAGVYYKPNSLKAEFCKKGARLTIDFCKQHNLPFRRCGKLLVATNLPELEQMKLLEEQCRQNQITTQKIDQKSLEKIEPNISGLAALRIPDTAITDFTQITFKMAELFKELGGVVRTCCRISHIKETSDQVTLYSTNNKFSSKYLVVCGGLMADRLARMMHIDIDFMIIPFRGEYFQLQPGLSKIVSHLIYPVPDPDLPFLGVHLTPMINGSVTVGPNAVMGWKREGYGRINIDPVDLIQMLGFPGFWRVVGQNLGSGIREWLDSAFKPGYLKRIQKYCPNLLLNNLKPYPAGIRAQAVLRDGTLVHDFLFARTRRSLHVCNAPSPAATSAIPIGEFLRDRAETEFNL